MGFSRPEYWSEQPLPSAGDLPNPGVEPRSPALQADFFYRLSHEIHQATAFKNFTTDIPGVVLARKQAPTVSSLLEATFQTATQGSEMQAKSNSLAGPMNLSQGWAGFCKQVQEGSWGASLSSCWWSRKAAV